MDWKDPKALQAVAQWARLLVGLVVVGLLVWMFATERTDLETVIKALVALLTIDKLGALIVSVRHNT